MIEVGKELGAMERVLDALALRQRVIGQNIANQDTPGYTRRVVRFEEELGSAIKLEEVSPRVEEDLVAEANPNGNNVHLEREWSDMDKTSLLYDVYTRALGSHYRRYLAAIRSR